ncbi:MAG: hypothetical protein ACFB6S_06580 [Geminicoccaceae bacterium]
MGALSSVASIGLQAAAAGRAAKRETKKLNDQRDKQLAEIQRRDNEARIRRQRSLREASARAKARAAGAGLGGAGGSASAILDGLRKAATDEQARSDKERDKMVDELFRSTSKAKKRSLLDRTSGFVTRSFGGSSRGPSLFDL